MNNPNNENPIRHFTLDDLVAMNGGERRPGVLGECLAADSQSHLQTFRFPCRIDAFIIGVGTEGETTLSYNLRECRLKKDTMFLFGPNNILQVESDEAFRAHVVAISSEFLRSVNIDIKNMMPLLLQFAEHPCFELSPDESQTMRNFIAMVENETKGPETRYAREVIHGLLSATIYRVGDILCDYLSAHPEAENPVHDRAEAYFRQFMQLLGEHFREERCVGYYARQLCITPKYLTTLIKRISGHSVSEWIDSYVILEAKALLKHSNRSIQEIAYYLNFPNQSFFGSYFKRNTGMSPSQYKEQR
ncbi:helix-turn-helix domain-containing protein [Alistipes sp.]|uniref:helix-turn-helix domain-containing protein n=1 Tax=Alistipes sp. TaxID=1872444 RepID=UPI003AEFCC2B